MAFVIAGIVAVLTVGYALLTVFAAGMSDSGYASAQVHPGWTLLIGLSIAAAIAASHWIHFSW